MADIGCHDSVVYSIIDVCLSKGRIEAMSRT